MHRYWFVGLLAMCDAACGGSGGTPAGSGDASSGAAGAGGAGPASRFLQISAGRYHTCALLRDGSIHCWGQGAYRQLGGDYGFQGTARRVETIADARVIECGHRFTCAVRAGGAVWCWGDDDYGQAGTADTTPCGDSSIDSVCVVTPQPVAGLDGDVEELALGEDHACARRSDGSVRCWGSNSSGQVGVAGGGAFEEPREVTGVHGATQVVAGDTFTCALVGSPGTVACWGENENGQVGNGSTAEAVPVPATVDGLNDAVEIVAGGEHACARRANGSVVCWGYNYLGQLGNGSTRPTRATSPETVVELDGAVRLAAGRYHTCALRSNGSVLCWGLNAKGELGNGGAEDSASPELVSGVGEASHVTAGSWHTCAAVGDDVLCWGDALGGQLGNDMVNGDANPTPVKVKGLPR